MALSSLQANEKWPGLLRMSRAQAEAVGKKAREAMKIGSAFPSQYLKKEDIGDRRIAVTMDHVEVEQVGQGDDQEQKPVLYFKGHDKGMALNRINAEVISEIVGSDETDDWKGHRIVLYVDKNVQFAGKRIGGIRVAPLPKGQSAPPKPQPKSNVSEIAEDFEASNEDVSFLNE